MPNAQSMIGTIDSFLSAVGVDKSAEAHTEPGSIGGATTHPVKNVDDRTEAAKEGERSAENTADVKDDQGKPGVDSTPEAKTASANVFDFAGSLAKKADGGAVQTPGSAADDHLQIGTNVQATGDDPSNETKKVKPGKDDPGSSHPARTDNGELDGHKYAYDGNTPLEKMAGDFKELAENICAQIAWMSKEEGNVKTAAAAQQHAGNKPATPPTPVKQAQAIDPQLAGQAGWELAGLLNGTLDKAAADKMVEGTIAEIIKTASDDADRLIRYYDAYFKQSGDEAPPEDAGGGEPSGGEGGDLMGGGGGGDPSGMMAALGGGADAGGGGMPGGDPMGGGGGEGGGDAEAQQLAMLLQQMGVTPEELEAAMQQIGGGGGGAMPPGGGGGMGGGAMPPGGAGAPPPGGGGGMEVAASDKTAEMRNYITEVISRSKRRAA
jgi:hypothetical protein